MKGIEIKRYTVLSEGGREREAQREREGERERERRERERENKDFYQNAKYVYDRNFALDNEIHLMRQ